MSQHTIESTGLERSTLTKICQQTLAAPVEQSGIGLHSGQLVRVCIQPAEANTGRRFVRIDQPGAPTIPARCQAVEQTVLSTELRCGNASVRTVEHLLATLVGLGIDNACIEIDGPEVPLLDGSARDWVAAIAVVGLVQQPTQRSTAQLRSPVWVQDGDAFVAALPAPALRFTYGIDFEVSAIGSQWFSWTPASQGDPFITEIAPARTFGLAHQIEYLRSQNLIRGGSLENALVCDGDRWLNPPLRFDNEPVRHKLLDLLGDLSLMGTLPQAHFLAYKASHRLHVQLSKDVQEVLELNQKPL